MSEPVPAESRHFHEEAPVGLTNADPMRRTRRVSPGRAFLWTPAPGFEEAPELARLDYEVSKVSDSACSRGRVRGGLERPAGPGPLGRSLSPEPCPATRSGHLDRHENHCSGGTEVVFWIPLPFPLGKD
jgi:hypothetical protein